MVVSNLDSIRVEVGNFGICFGWAVGTVDTYSTGIGYRLRIKPTSLLQIVVVGPSRREVGKEYHQHSRCTLWGLGGTSRSIQWDTMKPTYPIPPNN